MNKERKNAILNYLYPTAEIAKFMLFDLYVELLNVVPKNICFSSKNYNFEARSKNKALAKEKVKQFLSDNINYQSRLTELFLNTELDCIIDNILIGYILFLTPRINKNTGADVFQDKRSIYYTRYSILDLT